MLDGGMLLRRLQGARRKMKPSYIVIPELAGRLIVGDMPGDAGGQVKLSDETGATHWIDIDPLWAEATGWPRYHVQVDDSLDQRVATLSWYMKQSLEAGTKFYIFPRPAAWETCAMCLMARYGWTIRRAQEVLNALSESEIDLKAAEAAYKAWLERGSQ